MTYTIQQFKEMIAKQSDAELYETYKTNRLHLGAIDTFSLTGIPLESDEAFWTLERVVQARHDAIATERGKR